MTFQEIAERTIRESKKILTAKWRKGGVSGILESRLATLPQAVTLNQAKVSKLYAKGTILILLDVHSKM